MKEIIKGITTRYIFRNMDKKSVQLDVTVYDVETASNVKVHDIVLHVDGIEMNYNYNNTNGQSCIYGKCNSSIHEMLFNNKGEGRIKIRTKIGDEYLIAIPEDISSDIYNSLKNNDK